jgi:hypothetical protein
LESGDRRPTSWNLSRKTKAPLLFLARFESFLKALQVAGVLVLLERVRRLLSIFRQTSSQNELRPL